MNRHLADSKRRVFKQLQFSELERANRLIFASKSYWNYSGEYLEAAFQLLRIKDIDLEKQFFWCLWEGSVLVGLFSFDETQEAILLDHFWIYPHRIGTGCGRHLWNFAIQIAKQQKYRSFQIYSDPQAEGFYLKMGAKRIGEKPSRILSGPIFPILEFPIEN